MLGRVPLDFPDSESVMQGQPKKHRNLTPDAAAGVGLWEENGEVFHPLVEQCILYPSNRKHVGQLSAKENM